MRTRVGYAGGEKDAPTYRDMGDHSEVLQVDHDPEVLSWADLLELFWESHDPCAPRRSRQYMSAVFVEGDEQRELAFDTGRRHAEAQGGSLTTAILPLTTFTRAEDYHQKWSLRRDGAVVDALQEIYPDPAAFTDSTVAARLNGALAGHSLPKALRDDPSLLGLPDRILDRLRRSLDVV